MRRALAPTPGGLHRITGSKASFGFDAKDNGLINNRQNGRRRGRGGNNNSNPRQGGGSGGGGGRADSGNRIDSRARGNANQLYEKYKNLARDAQMSGDRVNIENYLQYADHYFRVLADTRSRFEDNNQPRRQQPFDLDGDDDDDNNNEGEPIRSGEQNARDGNREVNRDANRDGARDFNRDPDRPARGPRRDRDDNREAGNRNDPAREEGSEAQRANRSQDDDRPQRPRRERVARDDRPTQPTHDSASQDRVSQDRVSQDRTSQDGANQEGASQHRATQDRVSRDAPGEDDGALVPRRRGRPRKEQDDAPTAIAADVLPPSLGSAAATDSEGEPKPRRRRVTRAATEAPTAAE